MEICKQCKMVERCIASGVPLETVVFLMIYLSGHKEEPTTADRFRRILRRRGKELEPTLDYFKAYADRCPAARAP